MNSRERQQMLGALGLVDWQLRADSPLARGLQAEADATGESGPAEAQPELPTGNGPLLSPRPAPPSAEPRQALSSSLLVEQTPWPDDADADRAASFQDDAAEEEVAKGSGLQSDPPAAPTRDLDWDQLEAWLGEQDHRGAQRPVFGVGARDAQVLIVGEAPGANEDAQGVPFVGRAGRLLDRMLFAIGCSRETNVYITNICKFRPPDNRDPKPAEVAADWPVLERQIELMNPKLVVAVGRVAAQTLLDSRQALGEMRGRLHRYPRRELDVLVTYHPAFLLRSPQQKAKAWEDLKRIAMHIGQDRRAV